MQQIREWIERHPFFTTVIVLVIIVVFQSGVMAITTPDVGQIGNSILSWWKSLAPVVRNVILGILGVMVIVEFFYGGKR